MIQNFPPRYSAFSCMLRRTEAPNFVQKLQPISRHALLRHPLERTGVEGMREETITLSCCWQRQTVIQCGLGKQEGRRTAVRLGLTDKYGRIPAFDLIRALKIIITLIIIRYGCLLSHAFSSRYFPLSQR